MQQQIKQKTRDLWKEATDQGVTFKICRHDKLDSNFDEMKKPDASYGTMKKRGAGIRGSN